jgi:hypothetical protein
MAEETKSPETPKGASSKDEVALELMKFIAVTTGYGKGATGTGFGVGVSKGQRTAEEYTDSLLELFTRCRKVVEG